MPAGEQLGVGMIFLPAEEEPAAIARQIIERAVTEAGLVVLGWRVVPVKPELLGTQARENQPQIEQILIQSENVTGDDLERLLYLVRKQTLRIAYADVQDQRWRMPLKISTHAHFPVARSFTKAWCDRQF